MYIIKNTSTYLLYLVIFIIFYFIAEKFLSWEKIVKWKKPKIVEDFIFGFFLGVITLIIQLINKVIYSEFKIPLFISTMILIAIFKEYKESLISMIPGFIYYLFNRYEGTEIYVSVSFSLMTVLIIFYLKTFLSKNKLSFSYLILLFNLFIFSSLISFYEVYYYNLKLVITNISFIYILTLLGYFLMNYIIKFTFSSKLLHESSRYSFLKFFRPSIAKRSINEFLIENKIKYGYLVLFHLNYNKIYAKLIESNANVDIENHYYKLLQDSISSNGILFNYKGDENGFFVPTIKIKGEVEMISQEFNRAIKILNKKYVWGEKNEIPLKIIASFGVSKYGIDSQNVNKLISYSSFALNEQPKKKSHIIFFNWKIYYSFLQDNNNINNLDSTFQLDDLKNLFIPLYDVKKHKHFATYVDVESVSEFQTYETVRERAYIKNFQNTFDRYFASSALLHAKGNKVIINYSPTIFEEEFIIERFIDFFIRNNIKYNSVYMIFDKKGMNKSKNFTLIKKRVKQIKDLGIQIIIPNDYPKIKTKMFVDNVEYSFIEAKKLKNFRNKYENSISICYDITTQNQVLEAYKNNISILGGSIFNQELNFIKFTKPSKIYLENIIEGAKYE